MRLLNKIWDFILSLCCFIVAAPVLCIIWLLSLVLRPFVALWGLWLIIYTTVRLYRSRPKPFKWTQSLNIDTYREQPDRIAAILNDGKIDWEKERSKYSPTDIDNLGDLDDMEAAIIIDGMIFVDPQQNILIKNNNIEESEA